MVSCSCGSLIQTFLSRNMNAQWFVWFLFKTTILAVGNAYLDLQFHLGCNVLVDVPFQSAKQLRHRSTLIHVRTLFSPSYVLAAGLRSFAITVTTIAVKT